MPTKPDPVNDRPPPWASAGNYTPGVYGPFLPWGAANILAGQPLPWGGMSRLNTTNFAGFCNTGHTPQIPDDASSQNEWERRLGLGVNWVLDGSNAPDLDAHIMETTAAGLSRAAAYESTFGYQGVGATTAILLMGFDVPGGEASSFGDGAITRYLGTAQLTSSPTAPLNWNGAATFNGQLIAPSRFTLTAGTNVAEGDVSVTGDNVRYQSSADTSFLHKSPSGNFKGRGQEDTDSGATVEVDTQAVAPLAAADVDVVAGAWIQRDGAGDVTVSILEVGGSGQLGVSQDIAVPDDAANDYKTVTFSRTRVAADTTDRVYRFLIDGNGADVVCKALHITATPTTS